MAAVQYGNSYADLNPARQTSGQSILALLGLLQRGQIAQQEEAYRKSALEQQATLQREWMAADAKKQADAVPAYKAQDQLKSAQYDAANMKFGSPDEVRAQYPLLPEGIENSLAAQSLDARKQYNQRARLASSTRDLLNQYAGPESNVREEAANQAGINTELTALPWSHHIYGTEASGRQSDLENRLKTSKWRQLQYQGETTGLNPRPTDKDLLSLVVPNPQTGRYESLLPESPWETTQTTSVRTAGAGAPAAAAVSRTYAPSYAAPTGAPSRANAMQFMQGPGVVAPPDVKSWVIQRASALGQTSNLTQAQAIAQARAEYAAQFGNPGMAAGGRIRGPGTSTSDSIPIRASAGEYIVPAEAMQIPGVPRELDHIRRMALHKRAMNMGGRYQDGGEVGDWSDFTQPSFWGSTPEDAAWNTAPTGMGSQPATGTGGNFLQRLMQMASRQQAPQSEANQQAYDVLATRKGESSFYPDQPLFGAPKQSGGRPNGYSVLSAYLGNSGGGGGGY